MKWNDFEVRIRRYLLLSLSFVLLTTIGLRARHGIERPRYDAPPEPGYVRLPPSVPAVGDFDVSYPPGGWAALRTQRHPRLEIEAWCAAPRPDVSIRSASLLLDGAVVEPLQVYPTHRLDIAEMFDRLDFFASGWHATLPLEDVGPGPHFLAMQVTLSDGRKGEIKRVELR